MMTQIAFTKGPWMYVERDNVICSAVHSTIIELKPRSLTVSVAERNANGYLVAAAPSLFDACDSVDRACPGDVSDMDFSKMDRALALVRDAIARAIAPDEIGKVAEIDSMMERLRAAEAIVAKLPRTADGIPVTPGMYVYKMYPGDVVSYGWRVDDYMMARSSAKDNVDSNRFVIEGFYSTREAARAAQGEML